MANHTFEVALAVVIMLASPFVARFMEKKFLQRRPQHASRDFGTRFNLAA